MWHASSQASGGFWSPVGLFGWSWPPFSGHGGGQLGCSILNKHHLSCPSCSDETWRLREEAVPEVALSHPPYPPYHEWFLLTTHQNGRRSVRNSRSPPYGEQLDAVPSYVARQSAELWCGQQRILEELLPELTQDGAGQ